MQDFLSPWFIIAHHCTIKTTIFTMAGFEATTGPTFLYQDHHEVLGCSRLATTEDLTRAYRVLAWKYHPENKPNDDEASRIFVRVGEAYTALANDKGDGEKGAMGYYLTPREAKKVYESKFGKFRKDYYDDGGIVGLPHAFVLSERIGGQDTSRGSLIRCGRIRVGFFRSWYLKTKIDLFLSFAEVILTWGTIAACVVSFMLDDEYDWYIGVVGGVGLLLSFFLLSFWYGFTRFPVLVEKEFTSWLWRSDSGRKDIEEMRDVCSLYFHQDGEKRDQVLAIVACAPVMLIDHVAASICIVLLSAALLPVKLTCDVSPSTDTFLRGLAKSTGAVMSAIVYYSIWILGGNIAKACTLGALLANQALYTSILCRMGFLEFLGLQLFRGVLSVSSAHRQDDSLKGSSVDSEQHGNMGEIKCGEEGVEVLERPANISAETILTADDESRGDAAGKAGAFTLSGDTDIEQANEGSSDSFSNFVVERARSATTNQSSSGSSELYGNDIEVNLSREIIEDDSNNLEVVPASDSWLLKKQLAPSGSRGPKSIDFLGNVYSARVEEVDEEVDMSENRQYNGATSKIDQSFHSIFQGIKLKVNQSFVAALKSASSQCVDDDILKKEGTERLATPTTAFSGGYTSGSSMIERSSPKNERVETCTIVGNIESSHGPSQFEDPQISNDIYDAEYEEAYDDPPLELLEVLSIDDDDIPRGVFLPTTTRQGMSDKEAPPPAYAIAMENASRQSILDKPSLPVIMEASGVIEESKDDFDLDDDSSIESSQSPPVPLNKPSLNSTLNVGGYFKHGDHLIPTHVNMLGTMGSVDEEDLTIIGLDSVPSPSPSPARHELARPSPPPPPPGQRGRRPAPGKLDLNLPPPRPASTRPPLGPEPSPLTTKRCDHQFVYFEQTRRQIA